MDVKRPRAHRMPRVDKLGRALGSSLGHIWLGIHHKACRWLLASNMSNMPCVPSPCLLHRHFLSRTDPRNQLQGTEDAVAALRRRQPQPSSHTQLTSTAGTGAVGQQDVALHRGGVARLVEPRPRAACENPCGPRSLLLSCKARGWEWTLGNVALGSRPVRFMLSKPPLQPKPS